MAARFSRHILIFLSVFCWSASGTVASVMAAGAQNTPIANGLPGELRPAIIFLHGGHGSGREMQALVQADTLLGIKGVVALYPTAHRGVWNDGINSSGRNDVAYLDTMIEYYAARQIIDPTRIYLAGISSGGLMVQRMLCGSRYAFRGAAVVMATHPGLTRCPRAKATPLLFFFGDEDKFFPPDGTPGNDWAKKVKPASRSDTLAFWAKVNGCPKRVLPMDLSDAPAASPVRLRDYPGCSAGLTVFDLAKVGHTWPGADGFGLNATNVIIQSWFGR